VVVALAPVVLERVALEVKVLAVLEVQVPVVLEALVQGAKGQSGACCRSILQPCR
jgi:hypothetical protein